MDLINKSATFLCWGHLSIFRPCSNIPPPNAERLEIGTHAWPKRYGNPSRTTSPPLRQSRFSNLEAGRNRPQTERQLEKLCKFLDQKNLLALFGLVVFLRAQVTVRRKARPPRRESRWVPRARLRVCVSAVAGDQAEWGGDGPPENLYTIYCGVNRWPTSNHKPQNSTVSKLTRCGIPNG